MITLYLVRHGETVHNFENRIQGHLDSSLTPRGVRQVKAVADRLSGEPLDAIYSSDLGRAMATAEAIAAPHALPVVPSVLLREAFLGDVQGLTVTEFSEQFPEAYHLWREDSSLHRPVRAESLESIIERCGVFLEQLKSAHPDPSALAVAVHSGSLRGLVCASLGLGTAFYRSLHSSNASLSILELGSRPSIRLLNDTCHLRVVDSTEEDADNVPD